MSGFHEGTESFVHEIVFKGEDGLPTPANMQQWREGVREVLDTYEYWKIASHTVTPITVAGTTYGLIVTVVAHQLDTSER